jgi:ubiquinone/menaquinone biosynthesis C-methylase UbiE
MDVLARLVVADCGGTKMSDRRSRGFAEASVPEAYDRFMSPQLFEPWAGELLRRAELRSGLSVLDVASGTGSVARAAAAAVGPDGRVVASDISPAMLAVAAAKLADPGWAPIEYVQCSVTAIDADEGSFDAVLCQHGLQFFPERDASIREMRRVAGAGGMVVVSTWAAERPLGLFGAIAETLADFGLDEPYPRAFDPDSYRLAASDLRQLLVESGLQEVVVETVELDAMWQTADDAVATLLGTPFGPRVTALSVGDQERVRTLLAGRLRPSANGTITIKTASNIGCAVK